MGPRHNFVEFMKCCCERPNSVQVSAHVEGPKVTARRDFGLWTDADIKDFVWTGGLKDRNYVKTDIFKWAKSHEIEAWVDIYDFWSGRKFGYFAVVRIPTNGVWVIKSLKLNDKKDPRMN